MLEAAPDSPTDAEPQPEASPQPEAPSPGPVILFDGVCNLCHAAVQWVIARDRKNVFRFASLQSQAARKRLAAAGSSAGERLDSMVLLDSDGVHLRSDAAIGIARKLGFPWSLARIGSLLPRVLRDSIYDWVARHRYRWFGRQNACLLPSPELSDRFLDAGEPPVIPEAAPEPAAPAPTPVGEAAVPAPAPAPEPRSPWAVVRACAYRVILVYLLFHTFPFPIGILPFTGKVAEWYTKGTQAFVTWVANVVFSTKIEFYPLGSGDTTYNYIELAVFLTLSIVAAIVWTLLRRGAPVADRTRDFLRNYVRLYLATVLLSYGWHKLVPVQMPAPGPDRLLQPIGDTSPMGLLWTFMGASAPYQMFAGLGEVVSGLLLFWRRTALFGTLVGVGVMTQVVVLNFCFDVPVKIFSSHLLLMCLFLLAPHVARLVSILILNLPAQPIVLRPFPLQRPWLRRTALVATIALFIWVGIIPAYGNWQMYNTLGGRAPSGPLVGTYHVESFSSGGVLDRANPDSLRWVRVGLAGYVGTIQRADGHAVRMRMALDKDKRTLTFTRREDPKNPFVLRYSQPSPDQLRIEGKLEGGETVILLHREPAGSSLLMSRGFHWINETPFNR